MRSFVLISVLVICCLLVSSTLADQDDEQSKNPVSARAKFHMPKIFDFARFKRLYHKAYASFTEEIRRGKIFFARALKVFLSAVGYKSGKSTKYLALNDLSDTTDKERKALYHHDRMARQSEISETPVADLEAIEEELANVVAQRDKDPKFNQIAAQLEEQDNRKRRKRDAGRKIERQLSMDQLMKDPSEYSHKQSAKFVSRVKSNNPDYEQPELASFGTNDGLEHVAEITPEERAQIDSQSSNGGIFSYIRSAIGDFMSSESSSNEEIVDVQESRPLIDLNYPDITMEDAEGVNFSPDGSSVEPALQDRVYLDFRDTGCFLQPKHQSMCGSCYVFNTLSVFEFQYCMAFGKLVSFSEQFVVDCGHWSELKGCGGGLESGVVFFSSKYGLELTTNYPYQAKNGECPYVDTTLIENVGHTKLSDTLTEEVIHRGTLEATQLFQWLNLYGPLAISIQVPEDFADYGGGVEMLTKNSCQFGYHAMTLIGAGIEDGIEYWLIRNSHGPTWGIDGTYKMAISSEGVCFERLYVTTTNFVENQKKDEKPLQKRMYENLLSENVL